MPYLRRDLGLASLVLGSRYRAQTEQFTSLRRRQSVGSTVDIIDHVNIYSLWLHAPFDSQLTYAVSFLQLSNGNAQCIDKHLAALVSEASCPVELNVPPLLRPSFWPRCGSALRASDSLRRLRLLVPRVCASRRHSEIAS